MAHKRDHYASILNRELSRSESARVASKSQAVIKVVRPQTGCAFCNIRNVALVWWTFLSICDFSVIIPFNLIITRYDLVDLLSLRAILCQ